MHISGEKVSGFEDACKALSKYYDYHSDSGICAAEPRGIGCNHCWGEESCDLKCWTYLFRIGKRDHDRMISEIEMHGIPFRKYIIVNAEIEADGDWFKDYYKRFPIGSFISISKDKGKDAEKEKALYLISYDDLSIVWLFLNVNLLAPRNSLTKLSRYLLETGKYDVTRDNHCNKGEWVEFKHWIGELPYSELITGGETE